MKPQITIEQLRRAVSIIPSTTERASIDTDKNSKYGLWQLGFSRGGNIFRQHILNIIDNPEKYKYLWEDGK